LEVSALDIVWYPDPVLRRKAEPILEIDAELCAVAERMIQLMHRDKGVGLAGPQVGLGKRIFIMCPTAKSGEERVVINPTIAKRSPLKETDTEGCLSLPGVSGKVERQRAITLTYYDLEGEERSLDLDGFEARVAQHEHDHLEGVLIIDRMGAAERALADKTLKDLIRRRQREQEAEGSAGTA
jgi:peptide deformylase